MALTEKVTQEDLLLYEILRNPVLCAEFIYNFDLIDGIDAPLELSWYQKEILCDFNDKVSIVTARATGKTVSLTSIILWALIFKLYPGDYILYTVPSKVHLEPVFTNLIRNLRSNSFLKQFIEKSSGINSSDYKITLLNGSVLFCRIAGQSGSGANLIGLHTPMILVDEGGYFPWNAFQEMQPSLNVWTRGHREMVAGVPTGVREHNVLYHADMENDQYTKHRVTASDNPRITPEDRKNALAQYGGEDSEDFIHYFLGKHGKPVFSLFDRGLFSVETYPVYQLSMDGTKVSDLSEYQQKLAYIPAIPNKEYRCVIGIDLGYTEPTAIIIMYLNRNGVIKFHSRIRLTKVSYPVQEKIIDYLDSKYEPIIIGVDRGNAGISVIQNFLESKQYALKNYKDRMIPIDFSGWTVLGLDSNNEEIKSRTKPFTVSVLQEYSNSHKIVYSSTDPEMISELERMTYTKNPVTGDISYRTMTIRGGKSGEDHFTSALLCGVSAYYLKEEFIVNTSQRKRLFTARWAA